MKKITLLTLILLTIFACRKNVEEDLTSVTTIDDPTITTIDYEPAVTNIVATLFGEVYDENGTAILNANVTLDGINTSTDEKGRFVFKDLTMNKLGTYVEVNKTGFFTGSNRFFPEPGSVNYVKVTLLDRTNIGNFRAADGGQINSAEGISIDFPANSVINNSGDLYQGNVEVAARWIDPTADNLQEIMPGGLQGIISGGAQGNGTALEEVALASFGMMAVELEGSNGEALNLGNNKKATLSFPIPAELLGNAPSEIPLWYFNESLGLWVAEGSATLVDDKYIGQVSHFSFWNCDAPFDVTKVCGTIVNVNGTPLANARIKIKVLSSGELRTGWTNSNGEFSGKIPADELLEISVSDNICHNVLLTENIGPIAMNPDTSICESLGTFTINNSNQIVSINAIVLACDDNPVTNGWLEINLGNVTSSIYVDDGNNVSTTILNCDNETELTVVAGNIEDLQFSDEATYMITQPLDLGTIKACDNVLPEWLKLNIDGVETVYPDVSFEYNSDVDTLALSAQNPGVFQSVQFNLINGVGGPHSYTNSDINQAVIRVPSTNGTILSSRCGIFSFPPQSCNYSQIDLQTFGDIGQLVTGEISGTLDFYESGTANILTKDVLITFSIFRD